MAELPKNIRRPGGELVPTRRPHGRRLLLPTEVELCKLLNLTEDEYWYFQDTIAAYNGQRPAGYELIPDIRCAPVVALVGKEVLIQIGIAIVAATISYLLTPKPKEQKQGGSRRTANAVGNTKFAPQAAFNSVQELAILGDAIPLIFSNQTEIGNYIYGGVRVNSQLLWSQFVSLGKYQQLKAKALFSLGTVQKPDYQGFAVGDSLLNTYNSHKVGLYYKDGSITGNNRILESDRYSESSLTYPVVNPIPSGDPFEIGIPDRQGSGDPPTDVIKGFSGARNPSVQTVFGTYSPFPNCTVVRLPYELCRSVRDATKESAWDLLRKRKKIEFAHWPTRCGFVEGVHADGTTKLTKGFNVVEENATLTYQIVGKQSGEANALQMVYDTDSSTPGYQEEPIEGGPNYDAWGYRPHGVEDVDSMTIALREAADVGFAVGELYLVGTAVAKCTAISDPVPYSIETGKSYTLTIIERGGVDIPVEPGSLGLGTHCQNPNWIAPADEKLNRTAAYSLSNQTPILWKQKIFGVENLPYGTRDIYRGYAIYTGMRVAFATVSNNRDCDVTEIGIKSRVFKQMQFANVNSQPGEQALLNAYNDRTTIQLGQINRYINRLSFFKLQVRKLGGSAWHDLLNGLDNHSGLFAIKGNTPEYLYNYISIMQERGQFEYRFRPFPGNYFTRGGFAGQRVNLLETPSDGTGNRQHFSSIISGVGSFNVLFAGREDYSIERGTTSIENKEWIIKPSTITAEGQIISALHNNKSEWAQDGGIFDGAGTTFTWEPVAGEQDMYREDPVTGVGTKILVYWDKNTLPQHVSGTDYHWVMYNEDMPYPYNQGISASSNPGGGGNPRGNGSWRDVWIVDPTNSNIRYRPSQNAQGGHPKNTAHFFYIDKQERISKENEVVHFEGTVPVYHGSEIDDFDYESPIAASGLKVQIKVERHGTSSPYYYKASWTLDKSGVQGKYRNGTKVYIPKEGTDADNAEYSGIGLPQWIQLTLTVGEDILDAPARNLNPNDIVSDWPMYDGDINSNKDNPEHEICFVNEIVIPTAIDGEAKYNDLAYAGLRLNSSKEWTNFSQFSGYFKTGVEIKKPDGTTGASNLFPEIAFALLTDTKIGAGELVGVSSVDEASMEDAAKFCYANRFFWDGTISSKLNLRDFIFEQAGYCLLDFTIIGGKFSLKPTVPVNGNFEIDKNRKPDIKCLFTDGNINDLKVSFLNPEDRQSFKAAVVYRKETPNGFPETASILVRSTDGSIDDPVETWDMSGFCTSPTQAEMFAKYAINTRIKSDHGLSFKTAPQYVKGLAPGDYFKLVSEVTHTTRFGNGAKLEDGTIVSKDTLTGSESVYYWKPGTEGVRPLEGESAVTLSQAPPGVLFTIRNTTTENKVYKCETISYVDDGLIEIAGSFVPTESDTGLLSVLQNWESTFETLKN